ncbi:MAG: type II toxin-antitoxin system RelE/ParE family toxin [Proteobacteria bacterium]|jgi:plasmid stabilization system protein ParE|nr:type II toxin-antitoxin system RelE/ParE family toxin [Pseudomonadota bacterium]
MTHRIIVRKEAEEDLLEGALWYEGLEDGLGKDFLAEVRAAIERTSENPLLYPSLRSNPDVRRVLTRRFKYRIFYILRTDAIVIFAVLHAARHDRRWIGRVDEA